MLNKSKYSFGYTLIEVLIAMLIMVILFSVTTTQFRSYQKRKFMENVFEDLKKELRFTQEMALSGRKPQEPAGNDCLTSILTSYTFVRVDSQTYRIDANCSGGDVIVKGDTVLPEGFTIQDWGSNTLKFNILGRGNDAVTLRIKWDGSGLPDKLITVTNSGTIE